MRRTLLILLVLGALSLLVVAVGRAAPDPVDSARPVMPAGTTEPSRTPSPTLAVPPPPMPSPPMRSPIAKPGDGAAPFVQTFANQPGVRPLPRLPSPTATHPVPAFADGCDHAYGDPTQCVPLTFPEGTTDKCAWLAAHGLTAIPVVGPDRQKLDPDGDKIACTDRQR